MSKRYFTFLGESEKDSLLLWLLSRKEKVSAQQLIEDFPLSEIHEDSFVTFSPLSHLFSELDCVDT